MYNTIYYAYLVAAAKRRMFNSTILLYDALLQSPLYADQVHDRFIVVSNISTYPCNNVVIPVEAAVRL
jgi:hypothetical protein